MRDWLRKGVGKLDQNTEPYLALASGALSRRDYLGALQLAKQAASEAKDRLVQVDAYILLALASLELGMPEDALAYAVGAHLLAYKHQDEERAEKAIGVVSLIVAQYPDLDEKGVKPGVH